MFSKSSATREFQLNGIAYIATYKDHEFRFCVDTRASTNQQRVTNYTDFDKAWYFDTDPPAYQYSSDDITTENIWEVKKEILAFVEAVLAGTAPPFFRFTLNERGKVGIYHRIALRLAEKYSYYLCVDAENLAFNFYKPT